MQAMLTDAAESSADPSRVLRRVGAAALVVFALAGCTALLPKSQSATVAQWHSFEEAKQVIDGIALGRTRRQELSAIGIDPYTNPSVTILTYPDILQRFAAGSAVERNLDPGIRDCLNAGKVCNGYVIDQNTMFRKRTGNFWADMFNFKRDTDVTGWHFNALIVMQDDLVIYTSYGGQPRIHEHEQSKNPLGPLQETGPSVIIRYIDSGI